LAHPRLGGMRATRTGDPRAGAMDNVRARPTDVARAMQCHKWHDDGDSPTCARQR